MEQLNQIALEDDFKKVINLSIFQLVISVLLLVISAMLILAKDKLVSIVLPPVMNQVAIFGLIPLPVLQLPAYPLLTINFALVVACLLTNCILLTQNLRHVLVQLVLFTLWTLLLFVNTKKQE